tara:strand:- start:317 stop:718 length:402 start_codon:yes stop_codon:yes gene_type:complete
MATTITNNIFFSDLRSDLAVNPANDDVILSVNEKAIETSIINLLQTNFYERPFQPEIGSNIRSLLFELATPQMQYNLKEAVLETIENFEPRCQILDVLVESNEDEHSLKVYITFQAINAERPVTFDLVLNRVR